MIGFIDVDMAVEMGINDKVEIYCDGKLVKRCVEASANDGYVKFYPDPITVTNGEVDLITACGEVKIVIND